ncbi:MAG: hypothetical protein BAJALOKI1v1_1160010 [Promethearchaeota archaeon]|nr:MAG: hypothetical protein BAJALOKI1v1_1160010 [Candidatus Lokiarchaeota archaeon]
MEWNGRQWVRFEKASTTWYGPYDINEEDIDAIKEALETIAQQLAIKLLILSNIKSVNLRLT